MKVTGQCHCGAIAYEAEVEQDGVLLCHWAQDLRGIEKVDKQ